MINILLYPVSLIPVLLIYIWIKKKVLQDATHQALAKKALKNGFLAAIPVIVVGLLWTMFAENLFHADENNIMVTVIYDFVFTAMAEELFKGWMAQRLIKKHPIGYSWLDIVVFLVIVAIGFDILESAAYALMTGPGEIILRGITLPHVPYAFIAGYFAGKAMKTGNGRWYIPAFLLPSIIHGTYNFCLSPSVSKTYPITPHIAMMIVVVELIIVIVMLRFMHKAKQQEEYMAIVH